MYKIITKYILVKTSLVGRATAYLDFNNRFNTNVSLVREFDTAEEAKPLILSSNDGVDCGCFYRIDKVYKTVGST